MSLPDRIEALPGWHAATALPTTIGAVAVVAVGPAGVFVVEAASAGCARTPAEVPERPLIHAWALARHLTDVLAQPVTPVLAVDARLDGLGGRRRGVHVVRRELVPNWLAERPATIEPARAAALVARGTGVGGFPIEEAADIEVDEVRRHLDSGSRLERVVFAVRGPDAVAAFEAALRA